MDATQRMVPLESGKRTGIKLDQAAWQAIDWLAERQGVTWQKWCAQIIAAAPEGENLTASVRSAAMDALVVETVFGGRGQDLAAMAANPLLRSSGTLSDQQLEEILSGATIQGSSDFGGFTVSFGHDEHGQDCVWIKNGLRGWPHFAFVVPSIEGGCK